MRNYMVKNIMKMKWFKNVCKCIIKEILQMTRECPNCYAQHSPIWRSGGYCNRCYCYHLIHKEYKDHREIYARILMQLSRGKDFT